MARFYINPPAIIFLVQTILSLILLIYLWRIPNRSATKRAFLIFLGGMCIHTGALAFESIIIYPSPVRQMKSLVQWAIIQWTTAAFIQYFYYFPRPTEQLRKEATVVLWSTVSLTFAYITTALYLYPDYAHTANITGVYIWSAYLVWSFIVVLRRLKYHTPSSQSNWFTIFFKPSHKITTALRDLCLSTLFAIPIAINYMLWSMGYLEPVTVRLITALLMSVAIFGTCLVSVNHLNEPISFIAKIVGIPLFAIMLIVSYASATLSHAVTQAYRPLSTIQSQSQLRFLPTQAGGYTVSTAPYSDDSILGEPFIPAPEIAEEQPAITLPFKFSFYEHERSQLFIATNGILTFDAPYRRFNFDTHRQPAIVPFLTSLEIDNAQEESAQENSGIYIKQNHTNVTITWHNLRHTTTGEQNSFQVILHADGTIDFVYHKMAEAYAYADEWLSGIWLVGLMPGNRTQLDPQLRFTQDISYTGQPGQALVENHHQDFRQYLHDQMLPLTNTVLLSIGLVLFGLPLLFRLTLGRPLDELVEAMRRVRHEDDLQITIPVRSSDEIGFLAGSFNDMTQSLQQNRQELQQLNTNLETEVAQRTSELVESNRQLMIVKEEAEVANRAKSRFLANMSHELRTPLNAVLGFTQILQSRHPELRQLRIIGQSGEHLVQLINEILDISRVEAGKIQLAPSPFHLSDFLQTLIEMMVEQTHEKGLALRCKMATDLPTYIVADEARLRQILLNLWGNAIKFTESGSITVGVQRLLPSEDVLVAQTSERDLCSLRFQIEDTGVGIDPEELTQIFEPFYQSSATAHIEGTGLGLSICRQLLSLMGSQMEVSSQLNQGSTFWFELMVPVASSEHIEETIGQPLPKIIGIQGPAPTVLVVDEQLENRAVLVDLLVPFGFHVLEAQDGQQALELALAHQPDVIITDLVMPQMDGFELIRQLRRHEATAYVLIIAVSATVFVEYGQNSLDAGSDLFLPKPLQIDQLLNLLAEHLELTWLYAEERKVEVNREHMAVDTTASEALQLPPTEVVQNLLDAAEIGDVQRLKDVLGLLEQSEAGYEAFIRQAHHFARTYQIQNLCDWLAGLLQKQ